MVVVKYITALLAFLITFSGCHNANSTEDDEEFEDQEKRLVDVILDEDAYDNRVRPKTYYENGTAMPVTVNVTFALYTFIDLDEVLEEGKAWVFIWESWWDHRLAWDPDDYGGLDLITINVDQVWFPDGFLYELTTGQNEDKGQKTHIRIKTVRQGDKFNAEMTLPYGALLIERCPMDMLYYPFDQQICRFCMGSMASTSRQIIFRANSRVLDRHRATVGGEWILVNAVGIDVPYREFSISCVEVIVKRRSSFFGVNVFFPTVVTCLLNTVGLFARLEESHTQVDITMVGQITLLNLGIILLTIAANETPKSAIISIFGAFFAVMISQTLLAAMTAMYLRNRFNVKERRAVHKAHRAAKAKEKLNEAILQLGTMLPEQKQKILAAAAGTAVSVSSANGTQNGAGSNHSLSGSVNQRVTEIHEKNEQELIRWEQICMWVHISFIVLVSATLTIIAVVFSPPTPEWRSDF